MAAFHGNAHGGGANGDGRVPQDLAGLVHHLHLFLGIAVGQENVDVREHVLVNGVGEFAAAATGTFGLHLLDAALAGAGDALVGAHHDALDAIDLVQGSEGQYHLDGRAVGVGNDVVLRGEDIGIDLRHHQRHGGVHAPLGGIVHHVATHGGKLGGQFGRHGAACAE